MEVVRLLAVQLPPIPGQAQLAAQLAAISGDGGSSRAGSVAAAGGRVVS
jgi:hypothetical protein